jgi:hypothetical protein
MKMMRFSVMTMSLAIGAALPGMVNVARAADSTAFELVKLGNDYVGKESKDKVVQIRSEKSVASMTPVIWFVVYYDPDATFKATEVKFGSGKKMDVKRPFRVIEAASDSDKIFDLSKLKIDSDKALKIASSEELVKPLSLRASQLWLEHGDNGPVWRVRLWAAKLHNPMADADIGDVYISATDGKVVRSKLHINSVD